MATDPSSLLEVGGAPRCLVTALGHDQRAADSEDDDRLVKLEIQVRPNASNKAVGGHHDGALVVRVREPAEKGRATEAALDALAAALSVPRRCIRLARGATSRRKLVEIDSEDEDHLRSMIDHLLNRR